MLPSPCAGCRVFFFVGVYIGRTLFVWGGWLTISKPYLEWSLMIRDCGSMVLCTSGVVDEGVLLRARA